MFAGSTEVVPCTFRIMLSRRERLVWGLATRRTCIAGLR